MADAPTLTSTLVQLIRRQIAEGLHPPGSRLPSIREMAARHGCAKNTIVNVFDELTAQGVVEPRRGSGFFVCTTPPRPKEEEEGSLSRAMDVVWLMREQLKHDPGHLRLGDGFPPVEWLHDVRLDKFHQKVVRTGMGALFGYGSRFGYLPLRQHLVQKLAQHGIDAGTGQIVLTHGANQALDIVIRNFVRPGDRVLVDEPGYYMLYGKLKLSGARIVGIPRLPDGPDVDALERELKLPGKPPLFFTQSLAHNPTASDTSPHKAHKILQLADRYDALIVENDAFADFKPATAPRIATLDQLRRTLYIGSFSKSVSAALRVGFIACHRDLASDLADIKMLVHMSSSEYCERTLDVILSDGHFSRHTARLRDRLTQATEAACHQLQQLGAQLFCAPQQSMYLWARFPAFPDARQLAQGLMARHIVLAPGSIFHVDPEQDVPWSRFNVGLLSDPRFASAMAEMMITSSGIPGG
ncbi:PLP-dependent aminotransferase family protein [Herbaspirillum sp. BH-1]|uniref:DNA-binding transcriptional MocR family regulator n=1 Tax=Herbaspirillum frisingense TaxID=92645 RepID=A0ABU1PDR4_9BURK|nr:MULTISPECIES: PLP-dependent aminotransferase family protein [Herbaspirillum]MDR6584064.1 DNA-binding transcriptional MocR family regulator [Herbaspirillum frisingense]PLY57261.1 PLP-dependent aminotransferase family protein [Herbaspirillum sp. BH-1]